MGDPFSGPLNADYRPFLPFVLSRQPLPNPTSLPTCRPYLATLPVTMITLQLVATLRNVCRFLSCGDECLTSSMVGN